MRRELQDVKEFMVACGQPILDKPGMPLEKDWTLRVHMLREEIDELEEAAQAGNLTEVADALTDIEYVLAGGFLQFGMGEIADPLFAEVQRSNMTKVVNGKVIRNEMGKIQKPEGYSKPDLKSIVGAAI
jgi:predicted HAD superfamily Cof-like phosphohydrolase